MDYKNLSRIVDSLPRWYYAIKGHAEKNGGSVYRVDEGYEIYYPDETAKLDFIQYLRNLGKEPIEAEDKLVIYDSTKVADAEMTIDQVVCSKSLSDFIEQLKHENPELGNKVENETVERFKEMFKDYVTDSSRVADDVNPVTLIEEVMDADYKVIKREIDEKGSCFKTVEKIASLIGSTHGGVEVLKDELKNQGIEGISYKKGDEDDYKGIHGTVVYE